MSKYNFEFAQATVKVYLTGGVYICKQLIERYGLDEPKWSWAEDREKHVLALFKDRNGKRKTSPTNRMALPFKIASRYIGTYTLREEEGALILVPLS